MFISYRWQRNEHPCIGNLSFSPRRLDRRPKGSSGPPVSWAQVFSEAEMVLFQEGGIFRSFAYGISVGPWDEPEDDSSWFLLVFFHSVSITSGSWCFTPGKITCHVQIFTSSLDAVSGKPWDSTALPCSWRRSASSSFVLFSITLMSLVSWKAKSMVFFRPSVFSLLSSTIFSITSKQILWVGHIREIFTDFLMQVNVGSLLTLVEQSPLGNRRFTRSPLGCF